MYDIYEEKRIHSLVDDVERDKIHREGRDNEKYIDMKKRYDDRILEDELLEKSENTWINVEIQDRYNNTNMKQSGYLTTQMELHEKTYKEISDIREKQQQERFIRKSLIKQA